VSKLKVTRGEKKNRTSTRLEHTQEKRGEKRGKKVRKREQRERKQDGQGWRREENTQAEGKI